MYIWKCIFKIINLGFYTKLKRICFSIDLSKAKSQGCSTIYSRLLSSWNIKSHLTENPLPKGGREVLLSSSFKICLQLKTSFPSMRQATCKHWALSPQVPHGIKSNTKRRITSETAPLHRYLQLEPATRGKTTSMNNAKIYLSFCLLKLKLNNK